MFGPTLRLLVCFVAVPLLGGAVGFAHQFYVTYVQHDQLTMDFGPVVVLGVLGFIPGFLLYVILVVVAIVLGGRK
jgi:hypothetical protein